jgi:nucleoside-diphosphate kinase
VSRAEVPAPSQEESNLSQRTFSIIKPDAVKAGNAGAVLSRIEKAGFRIVGLRMRTLSAAEAEGFYHVHKGKPFFASLCAFMSSGPCVTMVLERENAIAHLREIMGATNPANAAPGTIRKDFAASIETNAIHGSDAPDTAAFEIGYFFPGIELI